MRHGLHPHQIRVLLEATELIERHEKLSMFINSDGFHGLDDAEQERMKRQASIMAEYIAVLGERIAAFAE